MQGGRGRGRGGDGGRVEGYRGSLVEVDGPGATAFHDSKMRM